ncbi:MAG: DUF4157 domain-containing protein [Acidobacteriota bacterium]
MHRHTSAPPQTQLSRAVASAPLRRSGGSPDGPPVGQLQATSDRANRAPGAQAVQRLQCQADGGGVAQRSSAGVGGTGGLPDGLRSGLESLSGRDLSAVRVHYDSPRPAQLNANAFAQGTDIHVAPGQKRHLPHEGWHVVQQMTGRVKPTLEAGGVPINDSRTLESEADMMGSRAARMGARS